MSRRSASRKTHRGVEGPRSEIQERSRKLLEKTRRVWVIKAKVRISIVGAPEKQDDEGTHLSPGVSTFIVNQLDGSPTPDHFLDHMLPPHPSLRLFPDPARRTSTRRLSLDPGVCLARDAPPSRNPPPPSSASTPPPPPPPPPPKCHLPLLRTPPARVQTHRPSPPRNRQSPSSLPRPRRPN
ncbi:hypothetical protein BJ742DRAFT_571660 [Cladochytrium replicatum]|nr:hypothetical protein BJ742DRAFT_571660 [Cladochytrium replicatum]